LLIGKWRGIAENGDRVDMVFDKSGKFTRSQVSEALGFAVAGTYDVDFSFKPGHLDLDTGTKSLCIIEFLDDDTIRIECSSERPSKFSGSATLLQRTLLLKR
jgi:hypothetical protein